MKQILRTRYVEIPKGVTVRVSSRKVTVTGPRGSLVRDFKHFPCDMFMIGKKRVRVDLWFGNRAQASCVRTVCTHMQNMIVGVTDGYRFKMRFVYAHFPIQAAFPVTDVSGKAVPEGSVIEVRNFLGEHIVRRITMLKGVTVTRGVGANSSSEIVLEGNDLEAVSQSGTCICLFILTTLSPLLFFSCYSSLSLSLEDLLIDLYHLFLISSLFFFFFF